MLLSDLVIAYLFVGGAGGGMVFMLSTATLIALSADRYSGACQTEATSGKTCGVTRVFRLAYRLHQARSYCLTLPVDFFRRGWVGAAVVVAGAIGCLTADLGRIDRLFMLVTSPELSAITVGAVALSVTLAITVVLAWWLGYTLRVMNRVFIGLLCRIGIVSSLVTMVYTGVLLMQVPTVLAWKTPLIPVLFAISSCSCGSALLMIVLAFTQSRLNLRAHALGILRLDSAVIVVEIIALGGYLWWLASSSQTQASVGGLMQGELGIWFWVGLIGIGIAAPLFLECIFTQMSGRKELLYIAGCILIGGAILRYCIVEIASFDTAWEVFRGATVLVSL